MKLTNFALEVEATGIFGNAWDVRNNKVKTSKKADLGTGANRYERQDFNFADKAN